MNRRRGQGAGERRGPWGWGASWCASSRRVCGRMVKTIPSAFGVVRRHGWAPREYAPYEMCLEGETGRLSPWSVAGVLDGGQEGFGGWRPAAKVAQERAPRLQQLRALERPRVSAATTLTRTQVRPTNDGFGCRSLSLHLRSSLQMLSVNTAPSARGWSKAVLVNFGRLDVLTILHDDRACFQNIFFRGLSGHTYAILRRDGESSTAKAGSTFSVLQFCTYPASSSWCVFVSGQCVDRRHGAPPYDH